MLSYLENHNNVVHLSNPRNLGPLGARNKAVDHAKGEYIAFLDDDDYWHESKIEKQLIYAEDYSMVSCVPIIFNEKKEHPQYCEFQGASATYDLRRLFSSTRHIFPSGILMKKSNFEQLGGFNIHFIEHDFFYRAAINIGDILVLSDNLVHFDRTTGMKRVSVSDDSLKRQMMVYLKFKDDMPIDIFKKKMSVLYLKQSRNAKSNLFLKFSMRIMSLSYKF
jgi:glycosyltransferase involved in cell wall biosynthesis